MESYGSGIYVFFARLGVDSGWAEYFSRAAIRLSLRTHNGIDYFKNLPLVDLMRTARQITDVLRERESEED